MNKEKYLEMRKVEDEMDNCHNNNHLIFEFLRDYKEYLHEFKSKEAIKAVAGLKEFTELMDLKAKGLWKVFSDKRHKYSTECTHDIVVFDDREGYENDMFCCYCPLCREHIEKEDIKDNTMIIGVLDIYDCHEPSEGSLLFPIIDYMIKNDLDFTAEEFYNVYDILFPEYIYRQFKENYKVRVKK